MQGTVEHAPTSTAMVAALAGLEASASERPPLTLLPSASVGPYEIQPIQVQGADAGRALNEWMSENGFAELPDATLNYYLERGWTFLAVKTSAAQGVLEVLAGLPPLSIRFPTEHAVFPLKLSTHMGTFPLRLYLITAEALPDEAFEGAVARGFRVAGMGPDGRMGHLGSTRGGTQFLSARDFPFAPAVAPPALHEILADASMAEESELFVRVLLNERLDGSDIADWEEELAFPPFESQAGDPPSPEVLEEGPGANPEIESAAPLDGPAASQSGGCGCSANGGSFPSLASIFFIAAVVHRRRRSDAACSR